jgi:hypothetical protein
VTLTAPAPDGATAVTRAGETSVTLVAGLLPNWTAPLPVRLVPVRVMRVTQVPPPIEP